MTNTTNPDRRRLLAAAFAMPAAFLLQRKARAAGALSQFRPAGSGGFDHAAFDRILGSAVKPDAQGYNRVDYPAVKAARGGLDAYISAMQAASPSTMRPDEAHAYWINLYNAVTLNVVAAHYPVASIKTIDLGGGGFSGFFKSGPWGRDLVTVEDARLSLDDIEHRIVRPLFSDPMSHYGLNCASYSCPNLMTRAYRGPHVATMLRRNAEAYVNHPRGVSLDAGRITASKIYDWYAGDFGGTQNLKAHWNRFASTGLSSAIDAAAIDGYRYDWSLNAA